MSQWLKIDLYCLQNIVFHFWPPLTHAAWSLYDSWATCSYFVTIRQTFANKSISEVWSYFELEKFTQTFRPSLPKFHSGSKSAKIWLDFRHPSHFTHGRLVGNLIATSTLSDDDWTLFWLKKFAHPSSNFYTGSNISKFNQIWPLRCCIFTRKQHIWNPKFTLEATKTGLPTAVSDHFGPWSLRSWDRSVHSIRYLVISVLGHFGDSHSSP